MLAVGVADRRLDVELPILDRGQGAVVREHDVPAVEDPHERVRVLQGRSPARHLAHVRDGEGRGIGFSRMNRASGLEKAG